MAVAPGCEAISRGHWGGPGLPNGPKQDLTFRRPAPFQSKETRLLVCLPELVAVCPEGMVGGMNFETPVPEMNIYEKARRSILTVNQVLEPPWPSLRDSCRDSCRARLGLAPAHARRLVAGSNRSVVLNRRVRACVRTVLGDLCCSPNQGDGFRERCRSHHATPVGRWAR